MAIPFTCPVCGAHTEVDDRFAGQTGPCATCGKPIRIPTSAELVRSAKLQPAPSQTAGVVAMVVVVGVLLLLGFGVLVALALPVVSVNRSATNQQVCANNLKQIALAMHSYHDQYGVFPPAFVTDESGKPMHSWRVLLLPYLGEQALYDQYRFDQPWDGPNNIALASRMPEVYACPEHPDALAMGETTYVVVVGKTTMFPGAESTSIQQVTDGLSNTILVVESPNNGVNWLAPQDLSVGTFTGQVNSRPSDPGSYHTPAGANVVLADGSVRFLPNATPAENVKGAVTRNGAETATLDSLP